MLTDTGPENVSGGRYYWGIPTSGVSFGSDSRDESHRKGVMGYSESFKGFRSWQSKSRDLCTRPYRGCTTGHGSRETGSDNFRMV